MYIQIALLISIALNLRAFYLIGKNYTFKRYPKEQCCQGGRKYLYEKVDNDNEIRLDCGNKIYCKDK